MNPKAGLYPWLHRDYENLVRAQQRGRLPHALLLAGPRGIGKHELGRSLALSVLMMNSSNISQSRAFKLFAAGTHPDYMELFPLEDKTLISIDQVRELISRVSLTAQLSTYKVALIRPAETMHDAAANALLKTLEEPAGNTVIILISHNVGLLPLTIRSRCHRTVVKLPEYQVALDWLQQRIKGDVGQYLELANGSPLTAREFHDRGMVSQQGEMVKDLALLYQGELSVFSVAQRWRNFDLTVCISWLRQLVNSLIYHLMGGGSTSIMRSSFLKNVKISSDTIDLVELYGYLDYLNQASLELTANLNRELFMEQILSRWSALGAAGKPTKV